MAIINREVLTVDQMDVTVPCAGMYRVGIGLSGTWVGAVKFMGATDGVNFKPLTVNAFPIGAGMQSTTANGNFEVDVTNYTAVRVQFTRTSGSVTVLLAGAIDSSYQDAFLASTSKYISQSASGGLSNQVTFPGQVNRAWRLRTLVISFSVAPANPVVCTITDGASAVLWEVFIPVGATGLVGTFVVPLPPVTSKPNGEMDGGIVGTPGNSLVISLGAPGGAVASKVNAEAVAA